MKAAICALAITACAPSGSGAPPDLAGPPQAAPREFGPFIDEDPELRAPRLAVGDAAILIADALEPSPTSACNEQPPQEFLIRSHFINKEGASHEEAARRSKLHREAIEYRTRRYGFVAGFGQREWNRLDPTNYGVLTTFFDVKVVMNKRVVPALHCVEAEIRRSCADIPYEPRLLDGMRFKNTYHNGEVSNHAYGIAIDIDPDKNSCCGCVPPLNSWPRCKRPAATPFERTSIPKCWVDTFTRYGFYWLGLDPMEDTMHFEFLGDPDKIAKSPPSP